MTAGDNDGMTVVRVAGFAGVQRFRRAWWLSLSEEGECVVLC
jgi:hypothetical protein